MGRPSHLRFPQGSFAFLLLNACLLWVPGCGNTCVSGTINGGTTINVQTSNPPPSCSLNTAAGIVHMEIGAAPGAMATSAPSIAAPHIAHLFVSVAAVDIHSSAIAADDAAGWQPVANLQAHPLQVDLLVDAHANSLAAPFPDVLVPGGLYRQIRLRLASASEQESAAGTNRCGVLFQCAVMSDGRVRPVAFPSSRPELRIVLDGTSGRPLYVPPDGGVALRIELDRDRSWVWSSAWLSGDSLLLHPVFRLTIEQSPNTN